ncbi:DUF397 domain-containing protein [Streptomyces sp. NPDC050548]|uniref:DUF397 domain-containing protein n=1 Tax=Streptomyces sp. NPDC050548 TaxID=3365629 RepID=UPI00379250B6
MNNWRKSSHSGPDDGNECVEIATSPTHTRVSIRDSKAPAVALVLELLPTDPEPVITDSADEPV